MSATSHSALPYCYSRYRAVRRKTREVKVGHLAIGGSNPIRIQSMTTTQTQDVDATVAQTLALAEVGCEIVRITAPNKKAAQALGEITKKVRAAKCQVPLVADIHFLPSAAMEAALHVDKIRINPGNYADKKKFAVLEYSDRDYALEMERLHEAFSPIVLRCKELGRAMRIGTNHGSLSDRIMNRYGDTPLGMVESALEFIRIAESHNYRDLCLSMKASNPKVMIQAYRLAVARMDEAGMNYPLHLGVTEAGDGEDARVKSAIGIGALLNDGLGDTIRVSLTEDPVYEIPVARDLAEKAQALWTDPSPENSDPIDSIDPYTYQRRKTDPLTLNSKCTLGSQSVPAVIIKTHHPLTAIDRIIQDVCRTGTELKENPIEGLLLQVETTDDLEAFRGLHEALHSVLPAFFLEIQSRIDLSDLQAYTWPEGLAGITIVHSLSAEDAYYAADLLQFCREKGFNLVIHCSAQALTDEIGPALQSMGTENLIFSTGTAGSAEHPLGQARELIEAANAIFPTVPFWIRNTSGNSIFPADYYSNRLLEASIYSGTLLCDGIGDLISVETEPSLEKATVLAYNILQGARARISKTEFVACPSCGRTLFDLQSVTRTIRARTGHLKGVTIAVMGCIVNGPGEMADADFGYVGGAPGKINLYVGKKCVQYNVPSDNALESLVELIRSQGKWIDPTS